ncbi:hypothetical protein CBL_12606 [Carabus blaptoides fortunei]
MRYIKRGKKIVAIYSEHNRDGNQCKKRNQCVKREKKPTVHHEQPSTNQSRTPMEVFVEAIRNMQREMAEDTNFTSSGMNM